jgi:hypothetical protein
MGAEWASFAVVVRSECHDRTWVAHIGDTELANTPAGPLRIVKENCQDQLGEPGSRWRNPDPDTWVLEVPR